MRHTSFRNRVGHRDLNLPDATMTQASCPRDELGLEAAHPAYSTNLVSQLLLGDNLHEVES
jgi:hypothetical protein